MSEVKVIVSMGRNKAEITVRDTMTFGELRRKAETEFKAVQGGLRLLHQGKYPSDAITLVSCDVKTGTKMMAMRTKEQVQAEADRAKAEKLKSDLSASRHKNHQGGSGSADLKEKASDIKGDSPVDGQASVLLVKGRTKVRVNTDMSATVLAVKHKASEMDCIDSQPQHMKLLFSGKFLKDSETLLDQGVIDGASMMVLFAAAHHDAKDDAAEVTEIQKRVAALKEKATRLQATIRRRLLDKSSAMIARGGLEDEVIRWKDNLASIKSDDDRKAAIERMLSHITDIIDSMRDSNTNIT